MLDIKTQGACTWITLNRPDRANALGAGLVDALIDAVGEAIASRTRVLVLQGEGRSFCGGFDLSGLEQETDASLAYRLLRIELLLQTVSRAPCYTVALAHGTVAGAGADLAAACARRVADPETRFRFPGIRFGAVLGTRRLLELVGPRARSLILEQETVDAREAREIGLVTDIAEPSEWPALIDAVTERVERVPATAADHAMRIGKDEALGERDLGVLARSLIEPGLKQRIADYWESVRAAGRR